jgi:hypothetical protein
VWTILAPTPVPFEWMNTARFFFIFYKAAFHSPFHVRTLLAGANRPLCPAPFSYCWTCTAGLLAACRNPTRRSSSQGARSHSLQGVVTFS